MNIRLVLVLSFIAYSKAFNIYCQKRVQKKLLNPNMNFVVVDAKRWHSLKIETSKLSALQVEGQIEGEYQRDIVINIREIGQELLVSANFSPVFSLPNDKLGAHKVFSIEMAILIPEGLHVTVMGTNTKVYASGKYSTLQISLLDGDCTLYNIISENVSATTQFGNIDLTTKYGKVNAKSSYGTVRFGEIENVGSNFTLRSVQGDIHVNRTD